jgi:hypothetical protein
MDLWVLCMLLAARVTKQLGLTRLHWRQENLFGKQEKGRSPCLMSCRINHTMTMVGNEDLHEAQKTNKTTTEEPERTPSSAHSLDACTDNGVQQQLFKALSSKAKLGPMVAIHHYYKQVLWQPAVSHYGHGNRSITTTALLQW